MMTFRSIATLLVVLTIREASAKFVPLRKLSTPTVFRSQSPPAAMPVPTADRVPVHDMALPVASYASLAAVTAGSLKLMSATMTAGLGWTPYALMAMCVGAPVTMLTAQLATAGGPGIARRMGGIPADKDLVKLAHDAAKAVGVQSPEHVFEIHRSELNAFAASGFGSKGTTVAVTSGLRQTLTSNELGAVLAHEMGHLRYRDVSRNMHVAIAISGLGGIYEAGRMLLDSSRREKKKGKQNGKDSDGGTSLGLALMGLGLGSQALAHGIQLAASRGAEFRADYAAAKAFGANAMISALKKIDTLSAHRPSDLRSSPEGRKLAFAMISDGASPKVSAHDSTWSSGGRNGGSWPSWLGRTWKKLTNLLRTHPPMDERIAALTEAAESGTVSWSNPRSTWW